MITYASPNYTPRPPNAHVCLVVLHYTEMATQAALHKLCDPQANVSAHYLITESGHVVHLVAESMRAWHAGAGCWGTITDVNSHSIGIELANCGTAPFAAPLMDALETLLSSVLQRYQIAPQGVIAHSDSAPMRKIDPGVCFDWQRLARRGLSVWPQQQDKPAATAGQSQPISTRTDRFMALARCFGYTASTKPQTILSAFRLRFRPRCCDALEVNETDLALITDLAERFVFDANAESTYPSKAES